jgi:hypothetical protein
MSQAAHANDLSIFYELTGSGWAHAVVSRGEQQCIATASYLSDALASLVGAAIRIIRGDKEALVTFTEEPGEFRWTIAEVSRGVLSLQIVHLPGWDSVAEVDEAGVIIFETNCNRKEFAAAVLAALKDVKQRYGLQGYRSQWHLHPFPEEEMALLQTYLTR